MLYNTVFDMIGETPMLEIPKSVHGFPQVNIYAKLEYMNPFGSIKDRTAYALIKDDLDDISHNKKTLIESSSGNMAKSLGLFGSVLGVDCHVISNRIKIQEQKDIIDFFGIDFKEVASGLSECADPRLDQHPVRLIQKELLQHPEKFFYTDQYFNKKSVAYHAETTGKEIYADLKGRVDYFCIGLGTTGSSRGIIEFLRAQKNQTHSIGIVSDTSDDIPGIRNAQEMWEVGLYEKDLYDTTLEITALDAIEKMYTLIRKVGILGGPTTGSNYAGVLRYIEEHTEEIEENANFVFIACDRFEPYLSYIKERKPAYFGGKTKHLLPLASSNTQEPPASFLHPDDLNAALEEQKYLIIDTRSNVSFRNIHIPTSQNIQLDLFASLIEQESLPFSFSKPIVLVCPFGKDTIKFSTYLNRKGYRTAVLQGGLEEWDELGYATESFFKLETPTSCPNVSKDSTGHIAPKTSV